MNAYDRFVLPHLIDGVCGMPQLQKQRKALVPQAHGEVLEVGIGTGRNLPFYSPAKVTRIVGLDPADQMNPKAVKRAAKAGLDVEILTLSAESIPKEEAGFDCVVCTFTLCTIPDPVAALQEMRRVLKPGGELIFLEHGLSPDAGTAKWQRKVTPYWKPLAGGCHMDRDVPSMLERGGFTPKTMERGYVFGPKPLLWLTSGIATAA